MVKKGFKNITVNAKVVDANSLTTSKVTYLLEKSLEEQKKLRKFAAKITVVPETVRVYSVPIMNKKERETLNSSKKDLPEES